MRDADDELRRRLREELDRVEPSFSSPRYLAAHPRPVAWRLAPAVLAVAMLGMLGLTAYSGSPNPVVWTERVVTVIQSTQASPSPNQAPEQHRDTPRANPTNASDRHESPEPAESPEPHESPKPSESPEPHESAEPADDHSGSGTSGGGTSDSGDHVRS